MAFTCQVSRIYAGQAADAAGAVLPVDGNTQNSIMQHIEDFLLQQLLPLLGPDSRTAAAVEATVSEELLDLHLANAQLGQRLTKW